MAGRTAVVDEDVPLDQDSCTKTGPTRLWLWRCDILGKAALAMAHLLYFKIWIKISDTTNILCPNQITPCITRLCLYYSNLRAAIEWFAVRLDDHPYTEYAP